MHKLIIVSALFAAACTTPATGVMVVVTADQEIEADARRLHITVNGGPSGDMLTDHQETFHEIDHWPIVIPVQPRDGDARRMFEIDVQALGDGDAPLITARAITGFVREETRALHIHLASSCLDSALTTPCNTPETCRDGSCINSGVDVHTLPDYAGFDAGTSNPVDGGRDDAGHDAGMILVSCGDGVVQDPEECDDSNPNPGDGCEPGTCRRTCGAQSDCDDGEDCNGAEICTACVGLDCRTGRSCMDGVALADGESCVQTDGTDGACTASVCGPAGGGCGDGTFSSGELCYSAAGIRSIPITGISGIFTVGAGEFDPTATPRGADIVVSSQGPGGTIEMHVLRNDGLAADRTANFRRTIDLSGGPQFFGVGDPDIDTVSMLPYFNCGAAPCFSMSEVDFTANVVSTRANIRVDPMGVIGGVGLGNIDASPNIEGALVSIVGGQTRVQLFRPTPAPVYLSTMGPETVLSSPSTALPFATTIGSDGAGRSSLMMIRRSGELERYPIIMGGTILSASPDAARGFQVDGVAQAFLEFADLAGRRALLFTNFTPAGGLHTLLIDPTSPMLEPFLDYDWRHLESPVFAHTVDLDSDGDLDAVVVTQNRIMLASNDGTAISPPMDFTLPGCSNLRSAAIENLNGDRAPDIVVASSCGLNVLYADP